MCIEEEDRGKLLVTHGRHMFEDERHNIGIVVLKEAEVRIEPSELVWEIRELSDLKELFSLHFTNDYALFDNVAYLEEDARFFGFS